MKSMQKGCLVYLFLLIFITNTNAISKVHENTKQKQLNYITNRPPLLEKPFIELPLGTIQAKGWLLEQLRSMSTGMTGNLDQLYEKVVGPRNAWLGGDGDGWERGPYWIDGLLPLAYILDDDQLKAKVQPWIEWSLNNQAESGYFGPVPFEKEPDPESGIQKGRRRDWWPKMVMLKVLQQYYSATGDQRVIQLMTNYFRYQLKELPKTPLDNWSFWGNRRGGDNLLVVYWLYNITGDSFLLELAELLNQQTHPWTEHFLKGTLREYNSFHCVNLAQGIKQPIIYYQQHPEDKYIRAVEQAFRDIKKFHGQPQGMYGGDEGLHGTNPTQGSEFCSAVELMYSLENMITITGKVNYADHLEKITFNALPTQANDDFTARQYFQCANQVMITRQMKYFLSDHDGTDLCYGVLTGYPCCTCNMHQGWPKFTQNLWYATPDNGIAALIYAPSKVTAKVSDGEMINFIEETNYPFDEKIIFRFRSDKPVSFPLYLRVPGWCPDAVIRINSGKEKRYKANQIVKISRTWKDGDVLELVLPMNVNLSRWFEDAVAVEYGPLVFALKIREEWKYVLNNDKYGKYYEVYPKDNWNYGVDEKVLTDVKNGFRIIKKDSVDLLKPWNLENAPIEIKTSGKRIPYWTLYNQMPGQLPFSPQKDLKHQPVEEITLVPYGCTTLRITEFPVVE